MKLVKTEDAIGLILCHDISEIVKGGMKGAAFKKGHVVQKEDIEHLLRLGKENLYVWEDDPTLIHENDAAVFLSNLTMGEGLVAGSISEGKIDLKAEFDGLFTVDTETLNALNSDSNLCISCRFGGYPVKAGSRCASMRVIPLAVKKEVLERAEKNANGKKVFNVYKMKELKCAVITTGSEVYTGRIKDTFTPVLEEKLSAFNSKIIFHEILPDDQERITKQILKMISDGAELVLLTGGMSVDPDDITPLAIRKTGAHIVTYGTPVLPGAMFLISYLGDVPILGLPGCVMYAKKTIFDIVLPKIMAGVKIDRKFISTLGHGGLLGIPLPYPYSTE